MTDLRIIPADPLFPAARATGNRDRSMPVVGSADPVGHWGDPRTAPFDARVTPFRLLSLVPRLLACMAPVALLAAALWSRLP